VRGVILFDFGGTLDADGARWSVRFYSAYLAAGGQEPFTVFEEAFRASDRALIRVAGIGTLGFRAMIDLQTALFLAHLPDGSALRPEQIVDEFHAGSLAVIRRNQELLARLQKSYRLAVVSNFTGNLGPCLEELDLMRYFSAVADSGRVGVAKPDPGLFRHALTSLGEGGDSVTSEPTWMVGDNFEADIRPAAGLGMSTAWLAPPAARSPDSTLPTARLTTLTELAGVVDS
jgi:FMN hydrolase / 5-amino-6-(5-phospho-D-ribitylamino)uracil phosphatase